MSYVTDVVCLFDWSEDVPEWFWTSPADYGSTLGRFNDIASYEPEDEHRAGDHWGGGKVNQCCVLAGAFNYLQHDEWIAQISVGEWPTTARPVIAIHVEQTEEWRVYLWNGHTFARAAPGAATIQEAQ